MAEYLNRIGAGLILLDAAPLSYDWIPPDVVGREEEQEQLAAMFASIGTTGMSCRAVITGNVGSGKGKFLDSQKSSKHQNATNTSSNTNNTSNNSENTTKQQRKTSTNIKTH